MPNPDKILRSIAKRFLDLPPFTESDPERAEALLKAGKMRHVSKFPGRNLFAVRFFIAGKTRFFAYASPEQLDDALRFADVCTLRFWKYRQRDKTRMVFNFSHSQANADQQDWTDNCPDIIALLEDIEQHLLDVEVFKPTADPQCQISRKTVRGELRYLERLMLDLHQEIIDRLQKL